MKRTVLVLALGLLMSMAPTRPAGASGSWTWPVTGPVIRGFDPPSSPYGSGHRGIDIATAVGTPVRAPAPGLVTFAGDVAGRLFVTIDHGGGVLSTCSFLSGLLVREGDLVAQGQAIALSGTGHAGDLTPNLHLGVRLAGAYVDPLDFLRPMNVVDLIRLAPIVEPGRSSPRSGPRTLEWRGFARPRARSRPSPLAHERGRRPHVGRRGPDARHRCCVRADDPGMDAVPG